MDEISKNVKHLSDAWNKEQTGNNAKMLSLNEGSVSTLRAVFKQLYDCLDIEQATGKTLDYYGDAVGQKRGDLSDDKFRVLILYRAAVNVSGVDYQSVVDNIINVLGCSASNFTLKEMQDEGQPATVKITDMPYSLLDRIRFTSAEIFQIVKLLLPIGVNLDFAGLDGTFEFCSEADYVLVDNDKSFADEALTVGGTWGMVIGQDDQLPL